MANNNQIGLEVAVQGEKQFRASLNEINAALRVNAAEMQQVQVAYEGNEGSVDALTAKYDVLDRTLLNQRDRVKALETQLQRTGEKYGEVDTRTQRLRESLIKAQTQLDQTKKDLQETSTALEAASESTGKLSFSLADVAEAAGVNLPPALESLAGNLNGAAGACTALVGGLAAVVGGLSAATLSTAETAKDLQTMAQTTGLTVEALQELEYISVSLGMEEDEVGDKMKDLTAAMRDARDGSEDMQGAFDRLGISVTERNGELRSAGDVFFEVVGALGEMQNATERDALAMQIFGEEAQRLNPMISAGIDTIRSLAKEANNLGYVMDTSTVEKFSELDTSFAQFEKQAEALKNSFAVVLLPILTNLFAVLSSIPTPVLQTLITLGGLVASIIAVANAAKQMTSTAETIKGFFDVFDTKGWKTTAIILGVVAALIALAAIIAVILGRSGELENSMSAIGDSVGQIKSSVTDVQSSYNQVPRYARGTTYHPGGRAIVGEYGPELVDLPAGSRVYPASRTSEMLGGSSTVNYYVTIDAKNVKEFNDIVRIAQNQKSSIRQGYVGR